MDPSTFIDPYLTPPDRLVLDNLLLDSQSTPEKPKSCTFSPAVN